MRNIYILSAAIGVLTASGAARAEKATYVDEVDIKTATELLHESFLNGVQSGARQSAESLLSDMGRGLLASFLNSYAPGSASLLGLSGGDGLAALQQAIVDRLNLISGQISGRFDLIEDAIRTGHSIDALTSFSSGMDALNQYRASANLDQKYQRRGSLEQALASFANTTNFIEAYSTQSPHESSFLFWQLHATALSLYIGAAEEYQMLTTVAAGGLGTTDLASWLLMRSPEQRQALDAEIAANFRNAIREKSNRVFQFYEQMGTSLPNTAGKRGAANGWNQVESVVDSWFTYVPHQSRCWDHGYDANWRQSYKLAAAYSRQCSCTDWNRWYVSAPCGGTAGVISWYYNVHAPRAACLDLKDPNQPNDICNRYFVVDRGLVGSNGYRSIFGSFDNETQWFSSADLVPDEHWRRVYAAYLTRTYAPVIAILDRLWLVAGNSGTRPRNGLDLELDFTVDPAVITPIDLQPQVEKARATIDLAKFPGHGTALFVALR